MKTRRRMNLTIPAPLLKKIRDRAAKLGTTQSAVIEDAAARHLAFQELERVERLLAQSQEDLTLMFKVFEAIAGPLFPQILAEATKRVAERGATRRADRNN
jgi:hypothetical protein